MEKEPWRLEKEQMVKDFHVWNKSAKKGQIVFTGSSLMEMFPIQDWVKELGENAPIIYNRGVGGYRTTDMIPILDACVFELNPRKVFINIGTNDLSDPDIPIEKVMENYDRIITMIEEQLPEAAIYMMAYYPINYEAATEEMKPCLLIRTNEKIKAANEQVKKIAEKHGQKYIDVNAPLTDEQGRLKAEYTIEGMHIKPEGYRAIFNDVMKYVNE
ncbi:MAG: lysophospholipase [Lachnospiraceae bacterium]|nr:lysophospholipase [Lachnospiraceae bacterium]